MLTDSILLVLLFLLLGISADFLVKNIKLIAVKLDIAIFSLGALLGIITSFPELSLGVNAALRDVANISAGNLFGGIMVIFGLIIGVGLMVNKKISTDGNLSNLFPETLLILWPLLLGIDGRFSKIDGLCMIISYVLVLLYLYRKNRKTDYISLTIVNEKEMKKSILFAFLGVIGVVLASTFIVEITVDLLNRTSIDQFFIGLIAFSIGTNLPEITITLFSLKRKSLELSLSHLTGSAITNILILGLVALIRPFNIIVGGSYYFLAFSLTLVMVMFLYFYHTNKNLTRSEGTVLFLIYLFFVFSNFYFG